jgi:hypothetical protein
MFHNNPCFEKNIKYKIFKILVLTNVFSFLTFDIISNGLNPQCLIPLIVQKENFHVQPSAHFASKCPFSTYHFVVPCGDSYIFVFSLIFCPPWYCLDVFLLLIKLKSFLNQNSTLI